ncbi:hypothetical protein [Deinococcus rubellus]|uniref:Uncharacterized protein n=1 Tax=Deinococcus rubellus TaxID=1889240 RepID=A0ABY5YJW6_9DEIO|nr:hypothetical protein [Deinococcus rubellus]UWX64431.1 hypothetical protein N0D28_01815 [Deinococcus rubellus]
MAASQASRLRAFSGRICLLPTINVPGPLSSAQQSHSVQDNAEDLTAGAGGSLHSSRCCTSPAIIRLDPAS